MSWLKSPYEKILLKVVTPEVSHPGNTHVQSNTPTRAKHAAVEALKKKIEGQKKNGIAAVAWSDRNEE